MRQKTVTEDTSFSREQSAHKRYLWLEGIFVLGCVVIGFLLRIYHLQSQGSMVLQENALFEKAMVLKDNVIPYMNDNLSYVYTYWMRGICSFFGNFAINILMAQVIMEELAILLVYFALRNLKLKDGAQFLMVVLQFLFYKGFATDIIPECLLLFSIGFVGWIFSKYMSYYKNPIQTPIYEYFKLFFVSILAAVPIYFHWIGCLLPIFMIFMILISPKNKKLQQSLVLMLGTAIGVTLLFSAKAIGCKTLLEAIGIEYYQNMRSFTVDTLLVCYLGTIVIAMLVSKIITIIKEITIGHKEKKLPLRQEELITKDLEEEDTEKKEIEKKEIEKKIRFLENPLPIPKKHIRKEMDYAIIPSEDKMKFDLELEPGKEEFDI